MDIKNFFKKNYIHFVAIGLFLIVGFAYFSMQFSGYSLIQHDIESHKGMAAENVYNRDMNGQTTEWSNSMFGGMPSQLILPKHEGNLGIYLITGYRSLFSMPFASFLLHLICFYIFAMLMRIKPLIAIAGAFAFAFASYEIIILQAGHNTKSIAVALLPAVLGAFIYTFRRNWKIGAILSAFFMMLEVAAGHPQVTYYLGFLLLFLGIYFAVDAFRKKTLKKFGIASLGIVVAFTLAGIANYGYLTSTNDYVKYSIRGDNDLTINAKGDKASEDSGLDIDYITNWSLDRGETFTFVSPYIRGSHSSSFDNSRFETLADDLELDGDEARIGPQLNMYWGQQPGVAGPFYLGVVVVFLALLALVFVRKPITYILFGVSILMLFLSWGKNLMWLTEFFVNNIPLYDNFRTVTIILVVVELCFPVLAVLLLQHLYDNRDELKTQKKHFLIASGGFILFLFILKFSGSSFSGAADKELLKQQEQMVRSQIEQMDEKTAAENGIDKNNPQVVQQIVQRQLEPINAGIDGAKKMRKEMYAKSTTRSILIALVAIGLVSLLFFTKLPTPYVIAGIGVLILIDLVPVNRNYLGEDEDLNGNYKHWMDRELKKYPIATTVADEKIFQMETAANPSLLSITKKGEQFGEKKAEELGYEGEGKRRVSDFYRFRALASATNYRVIDLSGNWGNAWNSSKNSYLHKSLGGYHPAKLRRIQNLFEFQLSNYNYSMFDMLNVKYIIRGEDVTTNQTALGNAWAIKDVKKVASADEEIKALGKSFELSNVGSGTLLVNGEQKTKTTAYAFQLIQYISSNGDTLPLSLPNDIRVGGDQVIALNQEGDPVLTSPAQLALDTAGVITGLINIKALTEFNPKEEVIIAKDHAKNLKSTYSGEANVSMTKFNPDRLEYEIDSKGKQFIVFSEIYYPDGWTATVDGKPVDIRKVNYLLRGIEVGNGKHKVVFEYSASDGTAKTSISWVGSILILLLLGLAGFWAYKGRGGKEEPKAA